MTTIPFGAQLIGRTEKTLNGILDQLLAGSGVSEPQWVALNVTIGGGPGTAEEVSARIAGALRTASAVARTRLGELAAKGLVSPPDAGATVTATAEGHAFRCSIGAEAGRVEGRLWGDLPAGELETAGHVLNIVLQRASAELDMQAAGPSITGAAAAGRNQRNSRDSRSSG